MKTKLQELQKVDERVLLERELNELLEATFKMEHELELLFQEEQSA